VGSCYNSGELNGEKGVYGIASSGRITNCYSVGKITGAERGAIGGNSLEHCYYLDTIAADATPNGALFATVKKLTAEQMKNKESFEGFDFSKVWVMGQGDYPYPVFRTKYEW
jgi:hypothetical protein